MKKFYNFSVALLAIAMIIPAASCSKQETPNLPEEPSAAQTITLSASMELPDSDTKTSLNSDNSVWWSDSDKISVFFGDNTTNTEFTLSSGSGSISGSFSGIAPEQVPSTIYAVYPYNANTAISGSSVTLNLPSVQTYKEGTFDDGMNPAVAYTSAGGNLQFKNLCGVLKLQLKSVSDYTNLITKISLYSPTDKLSGEGTVVMTDDTPSLTMSTNASNSVALDFGRAVLLRPDELKNFYIVVPPTTGKLKVTIQYSETGKMVKTTSATINRNKIRSMQELIYQADDIVDLSSVGTANCYIVPAVGDYSFDATVIGNGLSGFLPDVADEIKKFHKTTSAENAAIAPGSAQVLWQDVSNLITNVSVAANGQIKFTASTGKGNALIAAYASNNCSGDILWSWHIWCTDRPEDQKYVTADRTAESTDKYPSKELWLLDRNLGATSATATDGVATYGLFYQWGRKDPFIGPESTGSSTAKTLYDKDGNIYSLPVPTETSAVNGTIANTIKTPSTFFYSNNSGTDDWHYRTDGTRVVNNYLWGNPEGYNPHYTAIKSVYDPCPPGYMVAPKDTWTGFSELSPHQGSTNGWIFITDLNNTGSTETSFYPNAGYRAYYDGVLKYSGGSVGYGDYWSSSPYSPGGDDAYAGELSFAGDYYVEPLSSHDRAFGQSVRCAKEGSF